MQILLKVVRKQQQMKLSPQESKIPIKLNRMEVMVVQVTNQKVRDDLNGLANTNQNLWWELTVIPITQPGAVQTRTLEVPHYSSLS